MAEEKFLAFKGLKQYDPGMGWAQVHNFDDHAPTNPPQPAPVEQAAGEVLQDPLLSELFEQLNRPAQDDLAQNWKVIAGSVSLLSQRMNQQRELRKRLSTIDVELDALRNTILKDLQEIQRSADQQLSLARLRAEVSSLAQARLASRLRNSPP
jgi:hypothetical protein